MTALRLEETYRRHWSAADDAVLRATYGRGPAADLAARFGRSVLAVQQRARVLGVAPRVAARIAWTADADAALRADYKRLPTPDLAARLGTTAMAVRTRARALGITASCRHGDWTAAEDQVLRDTYGAVSRADLARRLGRTRHSIGNRLLALGLTREVAVLGRQDQAQQEIARLRAENDHLRARAPDAAHAPAADARRLATLFAYRLSVIDAATAATVLGVPVARLPVEVGKAAKLGLDVARLALGERA